MDALADGNAAAPLVQELFRLLHSLKGNAALFGCMTMKELAHDCENLLDALRQSERSPEAASIEVLQQAVDTLARMVNRLREGASDALEESQLASLRARIAAVQAEQQRAGDHSSLVAAELRSLASDDPDCPTHLRQHLLQLAEALQSQAQHEATGPLARLQALLTPVIEEQLADDSCVEVERGLEELRHSALDGVAQALAEECWDAYQTFTESIGFDEVLREYLLQRLQRMASEGRWSWSAAEEAGYEPGTPLPAEAAASATIAQEHGKSMRVEEEQIDRFLAYVGDLLVVGDMFHHLQRRVAPGMNVEELSRDFRRANETFQILSGKLQESIMSIRQVPASQLLRKAPRLARDLAQSLGKQVNVDLQGEELRLDKSLVELLDAPLTHLLRNALDHGIESPEERRAAGKRLPAQVHLSLEKLEQHFCLRVRDDGRGLDLAAIRRSAIAKGLLSEQQELDQQALINCIFSSGLSTAQQVSEVSGRGVGLDVVRQHISNAGGSVSVETEAGKGTTFCITLPQSVTTQIIEGFLVRCAGETIVLPMDRIQETLAVEPQNLHPLIPQGSCLRHKDRLLPLVPVAAVLNLEDQQSASVAVCCFAQGTERALLVDQVLGLQKVVLRPIEGLPHAVDLVSGGALLGDGSVALIVDVDALCCSTQRLAKDLPDGVFINE